MKRLKTVAFLVVAYFSANTISAQNVSLSPDKTASLDKIVAPKQFFIEKPKLFNNLPDKFTVGKLFLQQLFSGNISTISLPAANGEPLQGEVIERVQKNPNVMSINIKLSNYDGALFNVSRIILSDLSVSYVGRVINIKNGDILLLNRENDQFYFTKEKQSLVTVE